MIELTIKTLDSQNHKFSVPDTFTILELKEFIAAQVNIEVVQQRLIFHGRVLSNETKLADIGIDGKVMHLVQKVPRLSTTTSGSTSSATTNTTSRSEPNAELGFRGFHEHDPTIFSIGIPPELMQARELPNALSGRNNGNMSRESVALDMIRRGNEILNRLEHPLPNTPQSSAFNAEYREGVRGADDSESESSGTDLFDSEYYDSLSFESELSDTESSTESNMQPNEVNVIHLDENNVVIAVIPPCPAALPIPSLRPINQNETDTSAESEFSNVPVGGSTNQSSAEPSPTTLPSSASSEQHLMNDETSENRSTVAIFNRLRLRKLIEELNKLNERFRPFYNIYCQYIIDDPRFETTEGEHRAQSIFDGVSEVMNIISHVYHTISDLRVAFNRAPPRSFQSRPSLQAVTTTTTAAPRSTQQPTSTQTTTQVNIYQD